jgi:hypothetical protein
MATKLVRHGTNEGYKAESKDDNVCERCRNAHRVYQSQYSKAGKARGIKYTGHQVIDHLYQSANRSRADRTVPQSTEGRSSLGPDQSTEPSQRESEPSAQSQAQPSLADRLAEGISLIATPKDDNPYVETGEYPDYLTPIGPDPEPAGDDWSKVKPDEYVVTQANMVLIEDNMGTYLSILSMTMSLMDPYCTPNDDEIDALVKRWSKVVSRYPRAAKLFMSEGSGIIMDWIGAIQATWPILFRIYEHHLSGAVKTDKGKVYRVTQNGSQTTVDATMPEYEYTVN